jgi:hypothetical protein
MKNFIPRNLDIDGLLKKYPPLRIDSFSKDKLIYILHLLYSIPANNKDLEVPDGFVPIYSKILQRSIRNYNEYIDYLLRVKVLETDNWYIPGRKSRGYRYTEKYNTFFKAVSVANATLNRHAKRDSQFSANMKKKHMHIAKWYNPALQIDRELAMDFIHTDYERKLADPSLRDFDVKNDKYKDPFSQFTSSYINVERIADADFMLKVDTNVFRFHSNLSNIRSELRHCLTYGGENLVSIDIKNSQPYLSTILLNKAYWYNDIGIAGNTIISIKDIDNNPINQVYKTTNSINSFIMLVNTAVMQAGNDLQRFIDLVTQGTFYEYLSAMLEAELGTAYATRKQVKVAVFQVLFTDNRYLGQPDAAPKRVFKDLFPSVYEIFSLIKKTDKTLLPRLLQRIESQLILQVATKRIAKERPRLPIYTIHDSIATTQGNEDYVKKILEDELYKAIGYLPKLSTDIWQPSLMKFSDNQLFVGEEVLAA